MAGLVAALVLVGLALVLPGLWSSDDALQERTAELQEAERQRDAELTGDLVSLAEAVRADVLPVLAGFGGQDGDADAAATEAEVEQWRSAVESAATRLEERPSAGTAVNLARSSLAGSVTILGRAVEAYAVSLRVEGAEVEPLRELARQLRDDAVVAWSVAANQLDVAGVESGLGHVHVFLPPQGVEGELNSDHAPEGPP
ncbi:hypothetical protein [Amycolatopsis palatopharyngis]|uniref:hypothetical protein n=1 Tax=Amycolatopsis palatopharyngis TaxID=187982 RepID=UPI0013BEA597|nr:hypothetical protein [Amycolatopsis palatopharyngis]